MPKEINREERIGERLQRFNILESYHIKNVLIRQQHGDKRLFGEIAVDLGYIRPKTLESCIQTKGLTLYDRGGYNVKKQGYETNIKKKAR